MIVVTGVDDVRVSRQLIVVTGVDDVSTGGVVRQLIVVTGVDDTSRADYQTANYYYYEEL